MFCGKRGFTSLVLVLKKEHLKRSREPPCKGFIEPPVFCCDW